MLFNSKWIYPLAIFAVAILLTLPFLTNISTVPSLGGDYDFFLGKDIGWLNALQDGQVVPQVFTNSAPFGNGSLMFYGPLSAAVISLLKILTTSWAVAINLYCLLEVFLCGLFSFKLVKELSQSSKMAFVGAVLYMTAPNILHNLYGNSLMGTVFAQCFYPLLFLGVIKVLNAQIGGVVYASIGAVGIITSHHLSAVLTIIVLVPFLIANYKNFTGKVIKLTGLTLLLTVLLGGIFIVPYIHNAFVGIYPFYNYDPASFNQFWLDFMLTKKINWLWIPDFRTSIIWISFVPLIAIYIALFSRKVEFPFGKSITISSFWTLMLIMIITDTHFPFENLPEFFLRIQAPTRLLVPAYVFTTILWCQLLVILLNKFANKSRVKVAVLATILVFLAGLSTVQVYLYSKDFPAQGVELTEQVLQKHRLGMIPAEYAVRPTKPIAEVQQNLGEYTQEGTHLTFSVEAQPDERQVELPLWFWDGYKAQTSAGEMLEIGFMDNGWVAVTIPANYSGEVKVWYGMGYATTFGLIMSVLGVISLIALALLIKFKRANLTKS